MSLVARYLEAHAIATVVMGTARDIVLHCGVPRFVFSDFPLGNSAGKPFDATSQRDTLEHAFVLLETATGPNAIAESPQRWHDDDRWKDDYLDVARLTAEQIAARRGEFAAQKAVARHIKDEAR